MKHNAKINICDKDNGRLDENGVWVQDDSIIIQSCGAFIEPYSQQRAIYKYGIDVEVNRRIFIDHVFNGIKVGMKVKFKNEFGNDEECEIRAIPWYKRHMELIGYSKESVDNGS